MILPQKQRKQEQQKHHLHHHLHAAANCERSALNARCASFISDDCLWHLCHPFKPMRGHKEVAEGFFAPLKAAFCGLQRRDLLFIGGHNRRAQGGYWIASLAHYMGNFEQDFMGLPASGSLAFLRTGEFYCVDHGIVTRAHIILDLIDLMQQCRYFPLTQMPGTQSIFPHPATLDGVLPSAQGGEASLDLVERMMASLHDYDPDDFSSAGQTGEGGVWHPDMLWYGPAGIGANYRWSGFVQDHRRAFLTAFPDRKGGDHYCRIGDGAYVAVSGWPSMRMTHQGDYLGIPSTGKAATLRVMDFYRCHANRIVENWVLLDLLDLFQQLGTDLIAQAQTCHKQTQT